ncbi:hypothetical protein ACTXT7_000570 [Hymenolepis weldensis]
MSERVYRFSLSIIVPFHLKYICSHVLTRVLPQVTHINCLCISTLDTHARTRACRLFAPTLPSRLLVPHLSLSLSLSYSLESSLRFDQSFGTSQLSSSENKEIDRLIITISKKTNFDGEEKKFYMKKKTDRNKSVYIGRKIRD